MYNLFFWALWVLGNVLLRIYFRLSTKNLPQLSGGFIIAANHASLLDGVILQAALPKQIIYLLTTIFFHRKGMRWFFRALGYIPVHAVIQKSALHEAVQALHRGAIIGIFPEGGLSPNGKLQEGKHGVAALAEAAQVSVVPAAIIGSYAALPKRAIVPKPKKIEILFGAPLPPPQTNGTPRRERYQAYTEKLMNNIQSLINSKTL